MELNIGDKIKSLRLRNNLTQKELADRCELSKGFISQLESNQTSPSLSTLEDILVTLGSSFREFFASEAAPFHPAQRVSSPRDWIRRLRREMALCRFITMEAT